MKYPHVFIYPDLPIGALLFHLREIVAQNWEVDPPKTRGNSIWATPIAGWFIVENSTKIDDLGVASF